jgi:hypothetical protein
MVLVTITTSSLTQDVHKRFRNIARISFQAAQVRIDATARSTHQNTSSRTETESPIPCRSGLILKRGMLCVCICVCLCQDVGAANDAAQLYAMFKVSHSIHVSCSPRLPPHLFQATALFTLRIHQMHSTHTSTFARRI